MYNDLLLNHLVTPVDCEGKQIQELIDEIEGLDSRFSLAAQALIRAS